MSTVANLPYVTTTVLMENLVVNNTSSRPLFTVKTAQAVHGTVKRLTFTIGHQQARSMYAALGRALERAEQQDQDDSQ